MINGQVQTLSLPRKPLENVTVMWLGKGLATHTDPNGIFNLETVGAQDNWIFFEKSGYFADSSFITWGNQRTITRDIFLNTQPLLDSLNLYSVILNRYPSLQTEQAVIEAWISDPDNDVDTVKVLIPVSDVMYTIPYNTTVKSYERVFSIFDLEIERLEEIVGYNFQITIYDVFDHVLQFETGSIIRVIRDEVHFQSPSGNELTGATPTLVWEVFNPGFNFTYTLEIFTAEITPQLQWRKEYIDMGITTNTVDSPLPAGPYYWIIWAIDSFGNRTRSKPASFTVE